MPRRPRPAARQRADAAQEIRSDKRTTVSIPNKKLKHTRPAVAAQDTDEEDNDFFVQGSSNDIHSAASDDNDDDENEDVDAPRVVQWVDDEDLDEDGSDEENDSVEDEEIPAHEQRTSLSTLQEDLSELPLGSLRKAQRALALATADSDDESASADGAAAQEPIEDPAAKLRAEKGKEKEWSAKRRTDIAKRANKHAPTEVTSKRPVTRRREVIEVPKIEPRDPRFQPLTGAFDDKRFATSYGFLADLHQSESKTLRDSLKRARRMLVSSPRDLRAEREAEVTRLEHALKRAESAVNRDKRERVERDALERVAREEKERQKQGKGAWFMKDADKKKLLVKARYDALAASGGKGAVRKAIEKKQRKIGQKEKKSRPFAARSGGDNGWGERVSGSTKRVAAESDDRRPVKRPRHST